MTSLTYKQLAFILDVKPVEALEMILSVYCKTKGKPLPAARDNATEYLFNFDEKGRKKGRNDLPEALDIGLLSVHLNLPTLQQAVEDIEKNYLVRPATKKYILCDYPEKQIKSCRDNDKPLKISFPSVLESLLPTSIVETIRKEWEKRFPNARIA